MLKSSISNYYTVRSARSCDAYDIARDLCSDDRRQLEHLQGESIHDIIINSFHKPHRAAWTALTPDNHLAAIWGITAHPLNADIGIPWLLKTPRAIDRSWEFMRVSWYFDYWFGKHFTHLTNYVDAEYAASIRWLERLGYQQGVTIMNKNDHPFICMWRQTNV